MLSGTAYIEVIERVQPSCETEGRMGKILVLFQSASGKKPDTNPE